MINEPADEAPLRARIQADIAWLVRAPALIDPTHWQSAGAQTATCTDWRIPTAAELFQATDSPPWWHEKLRLGHHLERIHARVLAAQPGFCVVAQNLALHDATRTVGELDCLYSNAADEIIHREIAVKYFLGFRDAPDARNWIGTSKTDRLDLKLQKLTQHQLPLAAIALAQGLWPATLPLPVKHEVLMLGAFFRHLRHRHWPAVMNPQAEKGFWCTTEEFVNVASASSVWARMHKPWWLDPEHRWSGLPATAAVIAAEVESQQRPLLVAALGPAGLPEDLSPLPRGFVVPCGWEIAGP